MEVIAKNQDIFESSLLDIPQTKATNVSISEVKMPNFKLPLRNKKMDTPISEDLKKIQESNKKLALIFNYYLENR
jgi:hypothetical protein